MTEWGIFGVIAALASFLTVIVAPMLKLNTSITKLTITMNHMNQQLADQNVEMERMRVKSSESHERLWKKNEEQDEVLSDHDKRITRLEDSR